MNALPPIAFFVCVCSSSSLPQWVTQAQAHWQPASASDSEAHSRLPGTGRLSGSWQAATLALPVHTHESNGLSVTVAPGYGTAVSLSWGLGCQ